MAQALLWTVITQSDPRETAPLARKHVIRALELDPLLAEAHATDGYLAFWYDWDWERAERVFQRALELDPRSADTRNAYAVALTNLGRPDEAIDHARKAIEIDPLGAQGYQSLGYALVTARRYNEAIDAVDKALELAPAHIPAVWTKFVALLESGDHRSANGVAEGELAAFSGNPWLSQLAIAQAAAGNRDEAAHSLAMLQDAARRAWVPGTHLAFAYGAVGDLDHAIEEMHRAVNERDGLVVSIPTFGGFDPLRNDPRFERLLTELRFPLWSLAVAEERKLRFAAGRAAYGSSTSSRW